MAGHPGCLRPAQGNYGEETKRNLRKCAWENLRKSPECLLRNRGHCLEMGSNQKLFNEGGSRGGQHD